MRTRSSPGSSTRTIAQNQVFWSCLVVHSRATCNFLAQHRRGNSTVAAMETARAAEPETLEDVMLDVCRAFGVHDSRGRVPAMTGAWVRDKKIGAVGVQISGGVATHGLAFNRDPDLSFFRHIVSCGLPDAAPTSLADEMRRRDAGPDASLGGTNGAASRAEVEAKLVQAFVARFGYDDVSVHRE